MVGVSALLLSGWFALAIYVVGFVGVFLTTYRLVYRNWADEPLGVDNADRFAATYLAFTAGFIWPAALVLLAAYLVIRPALAAIEAEEDENARSPLRGPRDG